MKKFSSKRLNQAVFIFLIFFTGLIHQNIVVGQTPTKIADYVVFGGWGTTPGTYSVELGSSTNITGGGLVGSSRSLKGSGNLNLTGSVFSAEKILLSNNNIISGRVTAANNGSGNILDAGNGTKISGNVDVNGNIKIGTGSGSFVTGKVTLPASRTYSGPTPGGGREFGTPNLPVLPAMPAVTDFSSFPYGTTDIKNSQVITPGKYKELEPSGSKTITFSGTGVYVFKEIDVEGNDNIFRFDFKGDPTGKIILYVHEDVEIYKLKIEIIGGGSASRIYTEIHGNGSTCSDYSSAFRHVNTTSGSNNGQWSGTVFAPYGNIVLGFNSSNANYQGALWSGKKVIFQSNVKINFVPLAVDQPQVIIPQYPAPQDGKTNTNKVGAELDALCRIPTLLNGPGGIDPLPDNSELRDIYQFEGTNENNIFVFIEVTALVSSPTAAASEVAALKSNLISVAGMSGFIENGPTSITVSGKIPIKNVCLLETNAAFTGKIDDAIPLFPAVRSQGTVLSGGDSSMNTNKLREGFGLSGEGIKVGVISDSYNSYAIKGLTPDAAADISGGNLPGATNPAGLTAPVIFLKDLTSGTDEGRAMLQIIHDVAPKAELYFRTGFVNAYDFALGIDELVNAGCNVVVDDVTYFGQPFFRDGIVSKAVDAAAANGVSYFSSAGNFGNKAIDGVFNPQPAPAGILSRSPGAVAHAFSGSDIFQRVFLEQGAYTIVLQWDDDVYSLGGNNGAQRDLDIYLTDDDGNTLFGFNKNNIGKDPVEVLAFTATASAFTNIMVVSASGPTNVRFKYVVFRGKDRLTFSEYDNKSSTIVGHANAAGAMTVGAVRYYDRKPYVEDFSSTGGTNVNVNGTIINRNKPDFSAPNGVDNTFLGTNDFNGNGNPEFFGTSAAAPHAAATAALLLEARDKFYRQSDNTKPGFISKADFFKTVFTPVQVRELLKTTTVPVDKLVSEYLYPSGSPVVITPAYAGTGAINAESAINTFSNARPIIADGGIDTTRNPDGSLIVTITGEYLDPNTTIYIGGVEQLESTVNETLTEVTVTINSLDGNPSFQLYTPPQAGTNGNDGGLSDPKYLSDPTKQTVIIEALPASKKFGEILPDFSAKVTLYTNTVDANGLAQTNKTEYTYPNESAAVNNQILAATGLSNLQILSLQASNISKVGTTPPITPIPTALDGSGNLFIYLLKDAKLTINPMPIKIVAYQKKDPNNPLIYGQPIRGIQFLYIMDESKLGDSAQKAAFRKAVMLRHQLLINPNAFALIKDRSIAMKNGVDATLTATDLSNMAAMVSENSISEAEAIINSETEAIINSEAEAIINSEAEAIINDAELEAIINGEDLDLNYAVGKDTIPNTLVNISVKNLFTYLVTPNVGTLSSESEAIINALSIVEAEAIINSESEAIINSELEAIINSEAEAIINQEPVGDGNVTLNGAFLDINKIANNSELEAIINANVFEAEAIINSELEAIINEAEAIINTEAIINSETEAIINETEAIINSSGSESEAIINSFNNMGSSALNAKTVNDQSNSNLLIALNNEYPTDATSIKLRPVTLITGVEAGSHFMVPPAFLSENFIVTYGVGEFEIEKAKLNVLVSAAAQSITYGDPLPKVGLKIDISSKWYKNSLPKDVFASLKASLFNGSSPVSGKPGASAIPYSIKPAIELKDNVVLGTNYGSNYELGTITNAELTVNKAPLTITAENKSRNYGDPEPAFTGIISGFVADETLENSGITGVPAFATNASLLSGVGGNPYKITPSAGSLVSSNYTFNTFVDGDLTIIPRPLTVKANTQTKVYGSADPVLSYVVNAGSLAGSDVFSGLLDRLPGENVGQYAIGQGTLSLGDNYLLTFIGDNLSITEKAVTIKADAKTKVYGETDPALTYQFTLGNLVGTDAFSGALGRTTGENVGKYAINQGTLALNSNYALSFTSADLDITPKAITIKADPQTKVYGAADPVFTYQLTSGTLIGTDVFTGVLSRASGTNVGTYAINLGTLSLGANYTLGFVGDNLQITPKAISVKADPKSKVYGNADPSFTYQLTNGTLVGTDNFSGALSRLSGENVGTYEINAGTLTAGPNYSLTYAGDLLTITKAGTITVKANDKYIFYGDPIPAQSSYSSTYSGFKFNDQTSIAAGSPTYNLNRIWDGTLGNYTITPSNLVFSKSANYTSVVYQTGTLYVTPRNGYSAITISSVCVVDRGSVGADGFRYVARFTYTSNNWPNFVYIPLGADNNLSSTGGSGSFSGQPPVLFKAGSNTIEIPFNGQKLTWTIRSTASNGTKVTRTGFAVFVPGASSGNTRLCSGSGGVSVGGMQLDELANVTDQPSDSRYSVYPNPAANKLTVTSVLQTLKPADIAVYDLQGKLYRINNARQVTSNRVELDISALANGVYMIRVNTGAENKVFRIIKQ